MISNNVNIKRTSFYGEYIYASGTIETLSILFDTKFHKFTKQSVLNKRNLRNNFNIDKKINKLRGDSVHRALSFSLPQHLIKYIKTIFDLVHLPITVPLSSVPRLKPIKSNSNSTDNNNENDNDINKDNNNNNNDAINNKYDANGIRVSKNINSNIHSFRLSNLNIDYSDNDSDDDKIKKINKARLLSGSSEIIPDLIKSFYHVEDPMNQLATQSVFASIGQYFSPYDLYIFQYLYVNPDYPSGFSNPYPVKEAIGGHYSDEVCFNNVGLCNEANLDIQYIVGIAPVPTTYWYVTDVGQNPFLAYVLNLSNTEIVPHVHSISYATYEYGVPISEIAAFDVEMIKLGLRGITWFVSSGDDGVAGFNVDVTGDLAYCGYFAQWPSSSNYVTTIGGTQGKILFFVFIYY